jgi:amino acid permease
VLFVLGMFVISIWNVYCMKQLCEALEYLIRLAESPYEFIDRPHVENPKRRFSILGCCIYDRFSIKFRDPPPEGTSAFSKLGWYALGDVGRWSIDLMMLMLLLFINIALEVAILSFMGATPFTTGEKLLDGTILGLILVPFCIVDDMSALSKLSRLGLIVLGFTMAVVAWYGIIGHHDIESVDESIGSGESDDKNYNENTSPFNLFPLNGIEGVSKWFGCVVFSFGVVPLTFNFRESMAEPEKLPQTAMISMTIVGVCYTIIGISFLYLFPNIDDDLLAELPSTGLIATVTRIAMIIVVMASTPLLIVPCAEIIEGKIMKSENGQGRRSRKGMIIIRTFILLGTVSVAAKLPDFVSVLAFVGCFAVSMVSFVLPPGLHLLLLGQGFHDGPGGTAYPLWSRICDVSMLLIGFLTTIITTWFAGSK